MLHVLLAPAPQAVEDILLAKLHGYHHTIRHTLGAGIVVLDVANVSHRVANLEIHLVGTTKHIIENLLESSFYQGLVVALLYKYITVLGTRASAHSH